MAAAAVSVPPDAPARVLARVRAVAAAAATVELYGSSVYAAAHASDVDVLVSEDDPARLGAALGLAPIPTLPPRLHGELEGVEVDITVVSGEGEVARRMRAGPRDAALIAAQLREHGRDEVFQATWPHVRQFVRARALGHNGLGWFGSFGWALLLAIPLVSDATLRTVPVGAALPAWFRWLGGLSLGTRIAFDGVRGAATPEPLFIAAPTPPPREVGRLTKRAATTLLGEARAAVVAIGDAAADADAVARIRDLSDEPPPGTTLVIGGHDEHSRGRYDGSARGLVRELEGLGATRSWGRFDLTDDGWEHRITVPVHRVKSAHEIIERWLALTRLDAALG